MRREARWRVLLVAAIFALAGCASNDGFHREDSKPSGSKSSTAGRSRPSSADTAKSRANAAAINVSLGQSYLAQGQLEIAKEKLDKALALDPKSVDAHTVVAVLYERINDEVQAQVHYKRAAQLAPKSGAVLNNYGQFLCRRGQYQEADALFVRALADPFYTTPAVAHENRGSCARRWDKPELAEESFRKAVELDPKRGDALYYLGEILYRNKDYFRARAFVQRHEAAAGASAASLALAFKVEQGLGDRKAASEYKNRLLSEFPDSAEAKNLENADATQ